jgi:sorbitol/mannitol transport system substrate-binding protein
MRHLSILLSGCFAAAISVAAHAESLTIATVNTGDLTRMQQLSEDFTKSNPDIQLNWVTLEEGVLRERLTTDIATKGGQYDVMNIGTYEVPIWAKQGWLLPLDKLGGDFDQDDLLPGVRNALSVDGKLYAAPFYGESAMIMYRKDLFEKAGLKMPESPTWEFIGEAARKVTDRANDVNGICLRGKAGWGENIAFLTTLNNSFGGRWFDEKWQPQFDKPEWKESLQFYADLMKDAGPAGASSNGFNENLALFQQGKCGMWIDATVAASFVTDPKDSQVADKVGYAIFPSKDGVNNHGNWLWAWGLAIPASSQKTEAAQKFIAWATGKHYTELVASKEGWANVPPGTRT